MGQTLTIDLEQIGILNDDEGGTLATLIQSAVEREVRNHVQTVVKEQVNKTAPPIISQILAPLVQEELDKPVQVYSEWGSPKGEPRPLRDYIMESFQKFMVEKVDREGRSDSWSSGSKETARVDFIVRKIGEQMFKEQFLPLVEKAKLQFASEIDTKLREAIREAGIVSMKAVVGIAK